MGVAVAAALLWLVVLADQGAAALNLAAQLPAAGHLRSQHLGMALQVGPHLAALVAAVAVVAVLAQLAQMQVQGVVLAG